MSHRDLRPCVARTPLASGTITAKPTVEVYRAAKRVLTWLWHRKDLGVTYGGPDITCIEDLIPPDAAPIAPMSPRRS